jgi:hypothetical protein
METRVTDGGVAEMEAPAGAWEDGGDEAPNDCPLCRGWEPGPRLLASFEEGERMLKDPSLRRGYRSAKELFAGLDADEGGDDADG